jgi:hypothetical protein
MIHQRQRDQSAVARETRESTGKVPEGTVFRNLSTGRLQTLDDDVLEYC